MNFFHSLIKKGDVDINRRIRIPDNMEPFKSIRENAKNGCNVHGMPIPEDPKDIINLINDMKLSIIDAKLLGLHDYAYYKQVFA